MPSYADFERDYWAPDREDVLARMRGGWDPDAPEPAPAPAPPPATPPPAYQAPAYTPPPAPAPAPKQPSYDDFVRDYWAPDRDAVLKSMNPMYNAPAPVAPTTPPPNPYQPPAPAPAPAPKQPTYEDFVRDYWAPDRDAVLASMRPGGTPPPPPTPPAVKPPAPVTPPTQTGPKQPSYDDFLRDYWAPDREAVLKQMAATRGKNAPADAPPWVNTQAGQDMFNLMAKTFPDMSDQEIWSRLNFPQMPDHNFLMKIMQDALDAHPPKEAAKPGTKPTTPTTAAPPTTPTTPPPTTPTTPPGQWNQQTWEELTRQYPGTVAGLEKLVAEHPELGLKIVGGSRGDIQLPDGRTIDVLLAAGEGGRGWQWLTGGGPPAPAPAPAPNPNLPPWQSPILDPWTKPFMPPRQGQPSRPPVRRPPPRRPGYPVDPRQRTGLPIGETPEGNPIYGPTGAMPMDPRDYPVLNADGGMSYTGGSRYFNEQTGQYEYPPGQEDMAWTGGNPYFDERTGTYIDDGGGYYGGGGGGGQWPGDTGYDEGYGYWPENPSGELPGPPEFNYDTFEAPDEQAVYSDPGYQFRKREAENAFMNSAAAQGVLRSGGTLKDFLKYGQEMASQEYGNVYNRRMQDYLTNRETAEKEYAPRLLDWQTRASDVRRQQELEYSRAWEQYQAEMEAYYKNQQNMYDRLYGPARLGQQAIV